MIAFWLLFIMGNIDEPSSKQCATFNRLAWTSSAPNSVPLAILSVLLFPVPSSTPADYPSKRRVLMSLNSVPWSCVKSMEAVHHG
jgi:hypothetical protein